MNGTTFQTIREGLGHTRDSMAAHLGVKVQTVRYWEMGREPVPAGVAVKIERLVAKFVEASDYVIAGAEPDTSTREGRAIAWASIHMGHLDSV